MASHVPRRDFLQVGLCGGLGLSLSGMLRHEQAAAGGNSVAKKEPTAKSVIFIFMPGGMSQQESFDPKPYAPIEYRGPLSSINTALTGVQFGELWPQTAKIADKLAICRAMSHGEAAHERGVHNMFTGYRPSPALSYPSMGSVVSKEFGPRNDLPGYVCVPNQPNEFAGTGYLSSSFAGFSLGADPARGDFKVRDLNLPGGVDEQRFSRRRKMLDAVNAHLEAKEKSDALDSVDTFYQRAYDMIGSQQAREAFELDKEPGKLRDEYGRNAAGARLLLSRRLVESGVRFVTTTYGSWDLHNNISDGSRNQTPAFDQAFAALIRDLETRGLLDSTLVCLASEFGRTPKINDTGGRDHWPKVFSVLLAGGGIKRGIVYGESDSTASEPQNDRLTVEDWATTIYHCLGIAAEKKLMAPGGRPIDIVKGGKVRTALLA